MKILWVIIQREFVSNILTSRFLIGFIVCLLSIGITVLVQINDYENRLVAYDASVREHRAEAKSWDIYTNIRLKAIRKPKPLSIFNVGMEKRAGDILVIEPAIPISKWQTVKIGADNPLLAIFRSADVTFVFKIVLSFLAILFVYNTVSGEKEDGTLRLVLSNAIPRSVLILGKYLGSLFSMVPIVIISLVVAYFITHTSASIVFDGKDIARLMLIFIVSLLYVSIWCLLGILLSIWTQEASTTLMLAMFIWVVFTVVHSNVAEFAVEKFSPHKPEPGHNQQRSQLWDDFRRERDSYLKKRGYKSPTEAISWQPHTVSQTGTYSTSLWGFKEVYTLEPISKVKDLSRFQEILGYQEPLRIRYANRVEGIFKRLEAVDEKNKQLADSISRLSFANVYSLAIGAIAETDRQSYNNFLSNARNYRQEIITYLTDEKAFSSRQWFSSDQGSAKLVDLPVFRPYRPSFSHSVTRAIGDIFILVAWNVILFMGAYVYFLRYEMY